MPATEVNDAALLVRIASGDAAALIALYDRYNALLLALTQHILGAGSESTDVLHDLFLEVWCGAAGYRPQQGTVRTWLILRARELALETLRVSEEINQLATPTFLPSNWSSKKRGADSPMEDPRFGQERSTVQGALAGLSSGARTVLELAFFDAMPAADIAARVGLGTPALRATLATLKHDLDGALADVRR